MELALITARQVAVLFCLILAGYLCRKTGAIQEEGKKAFSDLLLYLVVPVMVIYSYMMEFDPSVLSNLIQAFLLSTALLVLGIAVTMLATAGQSGRDMAIYRFAGSFSNAAYMGFPLIEALFGQEGLLYASAFVTMFNILLWTVGYGMISGGIQARQLVKTICTTPVLIAVAAGLIIYLGRIPIPALIRQPLSLISGMNTPLSMIITGMMIAGSNLGSLLRVKGLLRLIFLRMVLIPALCFALCAAAGWGGMVAEVAILLEAWPSASITSVFAVRYGYNEEFAAGAVVFTTLVSIVTLPVCALLLSTVL